MADHRKLAGYACPFNRSAFVDGVREVIAPDAFSQMLARNAMTGLVFGWHGGGVLAVAQLFADRYGLGFSALLDVERKDCRQYLAKVAGGEWSYCSVEFTKIEYEAVEIGDGQYLRRVTAAELNHVCVTGGNAVYRDTAVWIDDLPWLPADIQQLRTRHMIGRARASFGAQW